MSALYRTLTGQSRKSNHSDDSNTSKPLSRQSSRNIASSSSTDPLAGTLNHLTERQQEALVQFKARLEKDGWWTPPPPPSSDSSDGSYGEKEKKGKMSHDDATLLRYLRARKFDVNGAVGQFTNTERWMKNERVEELYEHFEVEFYERARTMYPQWTGRRDRRGIPLYVYVIKHLDSKNVSKYQKESEAYKSSLPNHKHLTTPAKLLPLFALYQNLLNFVLPMCSTLERPNPEVPVTNSTNIVDISGVGLTQFWNLKSHMQDASVLATAHYPETLDRIYIIGAPAFFPTVWGWIKRWFDPVTVSKIFILSKHDVKTTLSTFIDPQNFPKRYGGELDWEIGQLPNLDAPAQAAVEKDGRKEWVRGPCMWLEGGRIVVGSEKGKLRRPDKDIERMKPVVYAADYTDLPVHPGLTSPMLSKGQAFTDGIVESPTASPPLTPVVSRPGIPVRGPPSDYQVAISEAIVSQLDGESVSTIPEQREPHEPREQHTNGSVPIPPNHVEILMASDAAKGLAVSMDQLALVREKEEGKADGLVVANGVVKPPMQRFVTAAEF